MSAAYSYFDHWREFREDIKQSQERQVILEDHKTNYFDTNVKREYSITKVFVLVAAIDGKVSMQAMCFKKCSNFIQAMIIHDNNHN